MPRLSQDIRNQALGMIRAGMTVRGVAAQLNVDKNTVQRLVQRHRANGSVSDRPRSGRPRVTTAAQDQYLRTSHLRHDLVFLLFRDYKTNVYNSKLKMQATKMWLFIH